MKDEGIKFPVYRRYLNDRSYFKILNASQFEEVQVIGSRHVLRLITAVQYPEKLFISDLLNDYADRAEEINASQYEKVRARVT